MPDGCMFLPAAPVTSPPLLLSCIELNKITYYLNHCDVDCYRVTLSLHCFSGAYWSTYMIRVSSTILGTEAVSLISTEPPQSLTQRVFIWLAAYRGFLALQIHFRGYASGTVNHPWVGLNKYVTHVTLSCRLACSSISLRRGHTFHLFRFFIPPSLLSSHFLALSVDLSHPLFF